MLRIRQRVDADISTVVGWIADADALNMFTGPRLVWPLTIDQLAAMTATDAVSAWVMIDDRADVIGPKRQGDRRAVQAGSRLR